MFRGVIYDNLMERYWKTKKCSTIAEMMEQVNASIERLCKRCGINKTDCRFELDHIEEF